MRVRFLPAAMILALCSVAGLSAQQIDVRFETYSQSFGNARYQRRQVDFVVDSGAVLADLNGDGELDAIVAGSRGTEITMRVLGRSPELILLPAAGDVATSDYHGPSDIVFALDPLTMIRWENGEPTLTEIHRVRDWNDAAVLDPNETTETPAIVAVGDGMVSVFEYNRRRGYEKTDLVEMNLNRVFRRVLANDIDADGYTDLLVHEFAANGGSATGTLIWYGSRRGFRDDPVELPPLSVEKTVLWDANGDGVLDIVTPNREWEATGLDVLLARDARVYAPPAELHATAVETFYANRPSYIESVIVADLWDTDEPVLLVSNGVRTTLYKNNRNGLVAAEIWGGVAQAGKPYGRLPELIVPNQWSSAAMFPMPWNSGPRFDIRYGSAGNGSASATSELPDANVPGRYAADKLLDGNPLTSWVENDSGDGIRESVTIQMQEAVVVSEVDVMPGYFDDRWWAANNRVRAGALIVTDEFGFEREHNFEFADVMEPQTVSITRGPVSRVELRIDSVYSGDRWSDTCIAEIRLWDKGNREMLPRYVPIASTVSPDAAPVRSRFFYNANGDSFNSLRDNFESWQFYVDGTFWRRTRLEGSEDYDAYGTWEFENGRITMTTRQIQEWFWSPGEGYFPRDLQWVESTVVDDWNDPQVIRGDRIPLRENQ